MLYTIWVWSMHSRPRHVNLRNWDLDWGWSTNFFERNGYCNTLIAWKSDNSSEY